MGRRYSKKVLAGHSPPARVGGSPARHRKQGSVSPPPRAPCEEGSAKKRVKEEAVSAAAAGRGDVCAGRGRVPCMGDVVECEMVELSAPGGVEWLAGEVIHVDVRKKVMKVRIQEEKEDETTSNEEKYKFSEEGKEWRWPSQAKRATSDTPASWSAKRKGKAYELKSDPDDDDLFVPRTSTTPSSCNGRKQPGKTSSAAARKKAASTSSTPSTAGTGTKGGKTSSANAKKAVATAKMYSMGKKKDGEGKEDDDSDDFMESKSKKRPAQDAEPVQPAKRKSMPKVAKTLMGIFAEDVAWDKEEEEAREQEKAAQEQDASAKTARSLLEEIGITQTQLSAACTQEEGAPQRRSRAELERAELEERGKWMNGIGGHRKRRKAKSTTVDESSDSDADDLTEGKKVLEKAYFPTRCFLLEELKLNNFNVKLFIADTKGKHTDQDGLDKIIMNNKLGGADPHVDDKERTRNIRVIDTMKGAKEYTKYFGVL